MLDTKNPLAPIVVGSGLFVTINPANILNNGTPTNSPSTIINLTASVTNFIHITSGGTLSVNTTGFPSSCLPIAQVVCSSTSITGITDSRPDFYLSSGGSASGSTVMVGTVGLPVSSLKVISTANSINLASGDVDLYTVPVGKKALVVEASFTNPTGSGVTITTFAQYKVSGVYTKYDFIANSAVAGTVGIVALLVPMLLNAGETFAVNSNNAGLSLWMYILEFDSSANINIAKLNSFTVGDNTLLTVPSNGIQIMSNIESVAAGTVTKGALWYFNNTGISRTLGWNLVPSGGSPAASNQIRTGSSISSPSVAVTSFYGGLKQNDFISLNTDSSVSGQSAHVIYQLLP